MCRSVIALFSVLALACAAACGTSDPPPAAAPTGETSPPSATPAIDSRITALVGERGSAAESQMEAAGYTSVGGRSEDNAAVTYWRRTSDGSCLMVRTTDGRFASVEPAGAGDCAAAETETSVVAEADSGGYRTVCGVMVDGKPVRYVCSVVGGDQRSAPTTLRFPDMTMTLHWLDAKRVRIELEGMVPLEGTWSESEGERDIFGPDQTWFYIANRVAAAAEVKSMGQ